MRISGETPEEKRRRRYHRRRGAAVAPTRDALLQLVAYDQFYHGVARSRARGVRAIRSVRASRKKRLSRDHGVKLLFARRRPPLQATATRMMNLWRVDTAPRGRLELVRDSLGAARFDAASSNIYGTGRSGIAE